MGTKVSIFVFIVLTCGLIFLEVYLHSQEVKAEGKNQMIDYTEASRHYHYVVEQDGVYYYIDSYTLISDTGCIRMIDLDTIICGNFTIKSLNGM